MLRKSLQGGFSLLCHFEIYSRTGSCHRTCWKTVRGRNGRREEKNPTKQTRETEAFCSLKSHFSLLAHTFHKEGGWESHQTLLQRDKGGSNVLVKWGAGRLQAPSRWRSSSCWSLSGRSPTACCGSPGTSPQTSSCWCKAVPWWTPPQSPRSHLLTKHTKDCHLEGVVRTGKLTQSSLPAVKLLSRARKPLRKHSGP